MTLIVINLAFSVGFSRNLARRPCRRPDRRDPEHRSRSSALPPVFPCGTGALIRAGIVVGIGVALGPDRLSEGKHDVEGSPRLGTLVACAPAEWPLFALVLIALRRRRPPPCLPRRAVPPRARSTSRGLAVGRHRPVPSVLPARLDDEGHQRGQPSCVGRRRNGRGAREGGTARSASSSSTWAPTTTRPPSAASAATCRRAPCRRPVTLRESGRRSTAPVRRRVV